MLAHVGNDVVYLADPDIAEHHERDRFVDRVCSAAEADRVRRSDRPGPMLWSMFAAKEAAYKAVIKEFPGIAFAPRLFSVSADLTAVCYRDLELALQIERGGEKGEIQWVHAVASGPGATPIGGVGLRPDDVHESDAVRAFACRSIAGELRVAGARLAIERPLSKAARDGLGPPRLLLDGRPSDIDISLSHDGPYVAYAALARAIA
jgi:phosphopantetheinyl transferase (holo-ACP synthase)